MPSFQSQVLVGLTIHISIFILTVMAHKPHHSNRYLKVKIALDASGGFNSEININASQTVGATPNIPPVTMKRNPSLPSPREFLFAHNKVRQGLGEPPLQWDKKLARYARRWAAKRLADCKMIHSYGPYGENIFWGGRDHWTPTEVVRSWANEYHHYHPDTNDCEPQQMCGHYTQIVWRDTTRVGCARVKCNNGGLFVMCSYDPPGNYVNESPFTGANPAPATSSSPSTAVQSGPSTTPPTTTASSTS